MRHERDKIAVVPNKGLNSGNNRTYLCWQGHDFVIIYTLKHSPEAFKESIRSAEGGCI